MRILLLADIHDNLENLRRILSREAGNHQLVLVLGNLGNKHKQVIETLKEHAELVKAIPGPQDTIETMKTLISDRMNLHRKTFSLRGFNLIGLGSINDPQMQIEPELTSEEDQQIGTIFNTLLQRTGPEKILISYRNPHSTYQQDSGSQQLQKIIEKQRLHTVISGEPVQQAEKNINNCHLLNPGSVNKGQYALLNLQEKTAQLKTI